MSISATFDSLISLRMFLCCNFRSLLFVTVFCWFIVLCTACACTTLRDLLLCISLALTLVSSWKVK